VPHFLVIGLGSIGRRHARNLATLRPSAKFTFVRREAAVDDLAAELGARVVTSIEHVDTPVNLAVVASPSANHIDTLPTLIDNGWPLLVEKPIVTSVADCDLIEDRLRTAPTAVRAAGFNLRHLPSIRRIKQAIDGGELGTIVRSTLIAGQWLPDWRPGTDYRESYSADQARGGGVELDLSHEIDLARWFFGDIAVDYSAGGHFSDLELDAHDTSVTVLSPRDAPGPIVTISLDYVSRQRVRWYEVVGDRGRIEWSIDGSLELMTADGRRSLDEGPSDFDVGSSYLTMMNLLLDATTGGASEECQTLTDGLLSTRLALESRDRGGHQ
jgi:predicted dehydrogenase